MMGGVMEKKIGRKRDDEGIVAQICRRELEINKIVQSDGQSDDEAMQRRQKRERVIKR